MGLMPQSLEEWQREWDALLTRNTERLRQIRESGERAGVSEAEIMRALTQVQEGDEFLQNVFKTAWYLHVMGELLRTPKWRERKRARLRAVVRRLDSIVAWNESLARKS